MMHRFAALGFSIGIVLCATTSFAFAQEGYQRIGYGRLVSNDLLGDGRDRWQTGSYSASYVWGRGAWDQTRPTRLGDSIEMRFDAALMSPDNIRVPEAGDRPLTGLMRFGLASQFDWAGIETDLQATLSFVGPETGLVDLQTALHDQLPNANSPAKAVRDDQLDLDPRLGATAEFARSYAVGRRTTLRPFLGFETGFETLARAGLDVTIGTFGRGGLQARDMVTGHRYRIVGGDGAGASFTFGADATRVSETDLLQDGDGVTAEETRSRLRAGVHWQRDGRNLFYGMTYLSPETEFQDDEGQTIGSIRIDWQF